MGLAASQARFLGITLRKANCEYKSTALAQQRLELTDKMTEVSNEYFNAINATKLVWSNPLAEGDFGLSYALLMTPSAANDYNPYMLTTKRGAIILNSSYAEAAKAAGIPMGGGPASETGYKKFIMVLGDGKNENGISVIEDENGNTVGLNIITNDTKNTLLNGSYHSTAGLGAFPKDKSLMSLGTITDLMMDDDIGGKTVDWLQIYREALGFDYDGINTSNNVNDKLDPYEKNINSKVQDYLEGKHIVSDQNSDNSDTKYSTARISQIQNILKTVEAGVNESESKWSTPTAPIFGLNNRFTGTIFNLFSEFESDSVQLDRLKTGNITEFLNNASGDQLGKCKWFLEPVDENGQQVEANTSTHYKMRDFQDVYSEEDLKGIMPVLWAMYEKAKVVTGYQVTWSDVPTMTSGDGDNGNHTTNGNYTIGFDALFHVTGKKEIAGGANTYGTFLVDTRGVANPRSDFPTSSTLKNWVYTDDNGWQYKETGDGQINAGVLSTITMVVNDTITMNEDTIKNMTLSDLLAKDIVIMTQSQNTSSKVNTNIETTDRGVDKSQSNSNLNKDTAAKTIQIAGIGILDYIAHTFGMGTQGKGINVDDTTNDALTKAYDLTIKKFLSLADAVKGESASGGNDGDVRKNQAYTNAEEYNRIGIWQDDENTYAALNLSNLVSTFLTYYDNFLRGSESDYYAGRSIDEDGTRTFYVTDDPNYVYTSAVNSVTNEERISDFYNQLYNNLCANGWRYDDHIEDYAYLESTIKDGRYSLMALNPDGYFYQARYNAIDYLKEESDRDVIARAEADFTRKKAEITNKEDRIDIKTKKLDAEIAELTTEINSVQQLITKSIEKTFTLFSN